VRGSGTGSPASRGANRYQRLVGNAGAHFDPINTVSKKDAEELIAFDVIRKPLVRRDIAEPLAQALHESAGKQSRVEAHPSRDASPLRGE
jgi:hypothetical protein